MTDSLSDHDLLVRIDVRVNRLRRDVEEIKEMVTADHDRVGKIEGEVNRQVARLDGRISAVRVVHGIGAAIGTLIGAILPWNKS